VWLAFASGVLIGAALPGAITLIVLGARDRRAARRGGVVDLQAWRQAQNKSARARRSALRGRR
jgi:hypothetical protein